MPALTEHPWLDRIVITLALTFGLWWLQNMWRAYLDMQDQISALEYSIGQLEARGEAQDKMLERMQQTRDRLIDKRIESWDAPPPAQDPLARRRQNSRGIVEWRDWIDD